MRLPLLRAWQFSAAALFLFFTLVAGETVRVASYNVENYLLMDLVTDAGWRPNYPKPEKSKKALRMVIAAVSPDILALQEMGTEPFLRELQRDLRTEGLDYPHAFVLSADDEHRHIAILSRLPFAEIRGHTDMTFPYFGERQLVKRGLLEVAFDTEGEQWSLFVVHLKSKWTERPDDPEAAKKRAGEATAARERILERQGESDGALYLIVGDFNDTRDTSPLRRFLQKGATEIASILPAADSRGHSWTHHWKRQNIYSRVDFLLPSPAMLDRAANGRGSVYDGPGYSDASDHRLVWADFRLGVPETVAAGDARPRGQRMVKLLQLAAPGAEGESGSGGPSGADKR